MSSSRILLLASLLLCGIAQASRAQQSDRLIRVKTKLNETLIAQTIEVTPETVTLLNLETNEIVTLQRSEVAEVENPVAMPTAVQLIGIPKLMAWRLEQITKAQQKVGKVAKVDGPSCFVSLGSASGIKAGDKLPVFRNQGEIEDPDSGEILGVDRPRIAELEVTTVEKSYCQAKLGDAAKVTLKVGDEVETGKSLRVAVCRAQTIDNSVPVEVAELAEQITSELVERGIEVVERSAMDDVLAELKLQNTSLFEAQSASKLGELAGATHVLTGKVVPKTRTRGSLFLRLVDVQTGKISLALDSSVLTTNSQPAPRSSGSLARGMRSIPSGFKTASRYIRTENNGLRIQGFNEFSIRQQGSIFTRKLDYNSRDFVYEVVVQFSSEDFVGNVGIGYGLADRSYNALKDCVYLRIRSPKMDNVHEPGLVSLRNWDKDEEEIGELATPGPHLIRISKVGDSVTFEVDAGNDGKSDDDFEITVGDLKDFAPYLHSKNSPLFFGGSGEYLGASVKLQ